MPETFREILQYRNREMKVQKAYDRLAPKPGDIPPDFELCDVNGENPLRLSDFKGKQPVALVFGSFT